MNDPLLPTPDPAPATTGRTTRLLAGLALLAAAAAAFFAWDARQALRSLEATAGGRLAELGAENAQARTALAQNQVVIKESQARIAELESRVAETHENRVALEDMYKELSRSADDRLLSEVEQILVAASQQLQLQGNVRGALAALQAADQRLARAEKLAVAPLRRSLAQDMDRLKALPQVDTVGIAVKIDNLITLVDGLPLVIADTLPPTRVASRAKTLEESGFSRAARDFWEEMKGLVRIRELETSDAALLTPSQAYFLRENLKLRLLAARISLLARDEVSFRDDVKAAQAWLARYFDPKSKGGVAAAGALKQLAESPVSISVPDINASLSAVRTARAAREKR
ncbi:uroporphyrinogen-III C-methyltransferase [Usitatibacter palustris]|uniref:Uroporphyrin-3 C-methyltransferase n=1 Tax=Usitatibacter palustris TaxID=2732487 RepID=A0A6M4HFS7_9PROT|nr:uroporphyrinogen-III C-methyltransferase [Usitatibacter palustris]QJR16897.1 hypothetical protein DSM104440_03733 [Usitatibacter palustris]